MITLTKRAEEKLDLLKKSEKYTEEYFLRVGVKGGGCSGLTYVLDFDKEFKEGDEKIDTGSILIVCDKKSLLYLIGTELDYQGDLNGKGFVWNNPSATRTCGCGESFSI